MLPLMALSLASCEKNNEKELSGDDVIQFEDPNFLKALLYVQEIRIHDAETNDYIPYMMDVDKNRDGQISVNEAKSVRGLLLSYWDENTEIQECFNIQSMPEIRYFTALECLDCSYNQLTSLDLSKNTALTELCCYENQLTSLDLSKNTALKSLDCGYNQLTSLDLSKNTALKSLLCGYNQLTSLDLSNNTALEELWCENNQLTSLDLSNNTALEELWCENNQLTFLDLSNNTALTSLVCSGNPLTKIILNRNIDKYTIQSIIEEYGDIIEYVD